MSRLKAALIAVAVLIVGGVGALLLTGSAGETPEEALGAWFADLREGDFDEACASSVTDLHPTFAQLAVMAAADPDDPPLPPPDELSCPESLEIMAARVFSRTVGLDPDLAPESVEGDRAEIGVGDQGQVFNLERADGEWRVAGFGFGEGTVNPARPPITLGD